MNSLELAARELLPHGWLLLLAFSIATSMVALLRRPCRRLFGAERAFQLWLLPPLAMLASQLPHAARVVPAWPSLVVRIAEAARALPATAPVASTIGWRVVLLLAWLIGMIGWSALGWRQQARYRRRLHGARRVPDASLRWPIWHAADAAIGPALVGAWRPRIVLPADFETRYDADERRLILAHEAAHAQRRDGCWMLVAQIVAGLCWFHPLCWWALRAFRHDQELACDAAVLGRDRTQRRRYANAMLKTQSTAFALPVGCSWSPRHPITERIAMLKHRQPSRSRRHAGSAAIGLLALVLAGAVYAATSSAPLKVQGDPAAASRFTLKIDVTLGGKPASTHFTQCVARDKAVALSGTDSAGASWNGRFIVTPAAKGEIEIRTQVDTRFESASGHARTASAKPVVRTLPGQQATISFGQVSGQVHGGKSGDQTIRFDMTPSVGCVGDQPM
jgi:beta-lactamase regulating signal transducer with metallopeptidase domain